MSWFENYLSERKQLVKIKSDISYIVDLSAGVPQGSVLGPHIFLVYVNDIPNGIHSQIRMCADDTSFFKANNNLNRLQVIINTGLDKILEWSKQWFVPFNPNNTEAMLFSNP